MRTRSWSVPLLVLAVLAAGAVAVLGLASPALIRIDKPPIDPLKRLGFPPEAFEPMTLAERNRLVASLPLVVRLLEREGYCPDSAVLVSPTWAMYQLYFDAVRQVEAYRPLGAVVRRIGWDRDALIAAMYRLAAARAALDYRLNPRFFADDRYLQTVNPFSTQPLAVAAVEQDLRRIQRLLDSGRPLDWSVRLFPDLTRLLPGHRASLPGVDSGRGRDSLMP